MTQNDVIREIIQTRGLSANASMAVWEAVRSERKRFADLCRTVLKSQGANPDEKKAAGWLSSMAAEVDKSEER